MSEYKGCYRVYGLELVSEIPLPELEQGVGLGADVIQIVCRTLEPEIKGLLQRGVNVNAAEQKVGLVINEVATFIMEQGKRIVVDKAPEATWDVVKAFILGSCLGFILFQRQQLAIHGGGVLIEDVPIIITGDKGAGKSTLTTQMRLAGYGFIADDVCALAKDTHYWIHAGYPQQKVCPDMMAALGYDQTAYQTVCAGGITKYHIPVEEMLEERDKPIGAIFQLVVGEGAEVTVEELKGQEKFITLYRSIFRIEFIEYMDMGKDYLMKCVALAQQVPVYRITRPQGQMTTKMQMACIQEVIKQQKRIAPKIKAS